MYLQIHHISRCMLLPVLLVLTMDVTSGMGRIQLIPQYPVINGSVTLSITGITERIGGVNWFKGPKPNPEYQILGYFPGASSPLVTGRLYNPRFSIYNNGSLNIKDLHITDGGDYTVKIQTEKQEDITVTMTVYERVTKPKITASIPQPKENDSFTLTCDTSHAVTLTWIWPGTSISSETKLSADNKTLSFSRITREDAGKYRCEAQNLVSRDSSDPYTVTVVYGPDEAKIDGTLYVNPGSRITLTCSADSFPPPEYQWKVNGTESQEKTNKYSISNAVTEDQGTYMCVVTNKVAGRSATASVTVNVTTEYIPPRKENMALPMIIGIAVAIVLLLILIAAIIYLFIIHKRRKNSNSKLKESSRNGQADIPTQTPEQHELQYAAIEFSKNTPRKPQQPETIYENRSPQAPPPTDNVVYSELKLR